MKAYPPPPYSAKLFIYDVLLGTILLNSDTLSVM